MQGCVYIAEILPFAVEWVVSPPSQCDGLRRQQGHQHVHTTLSNMK